MSRITLTGDKALIRKLDQLSKPSRVRGAARQALGAGGKLMNRSLKDSVPSGDSGADRLVGSGHRVSESDVMKGIKKSIGRRKKTYGQDNVVFEAIGPRFDHEHSAAGVTFKPSAEAREVEFGGIETQPMPFMRPGFESGSRPAISAITNEMQAAITKQALKG